MSGRPWLDPHRGEGVVENCTQIFVFHKLCIDQSQIYRIMSSINCSLGFATSQYLIHSSVQIWRVKTWKILSGRSWVDTHGCEGWWRMVAKSL